MTEPPGHRATAALAEAASVGPFFRLVLDPGPGWTPLSDFVADGDRVAAVIADARRALARTAGVDEAAVEPRVAASIWHLGLAAQVASPALAAAALSGWVPRLDSLRWRHASAGEAARLGIRVDDVVGAQVSGAADAAAAIQAGVVDSALTPLIDAVAEIGSVSEHVLWGNVWSAFAGAAAVIEMVRPEAGADAAAIVRALVSSTRQPLPGRYDAAGRYRRDTCCLYYRLPHGGLCGDCVLHRIPPGARQIQ